MSPARPKRADRVAERLRAELMDMLLRGDVRDPAVHDAFVTAVRLSDDLRHARIYVRQATGDADPAQQRALIRGLGRAASFIRRELSPRLQLKYLPELKFFWDDGVDRAARVEELLEDIREEGDPKL